MFTFIGNISGTGLVTALRLRILWPVFKPPHNLPNCCRVTLVAELFRNLLNDAVQVLQMLDTVKKK
jgi:hypothetical protein